MARSQEWSGQAYHRRATCTGTEMNCACEEVQNGAFKSLNLCALHAECTRNAIDTALYHERQKAVASVPMLLWCPECTIRHIDEGEFATRVHHTHACQHCGHVWRPAIVPTVGVMFLPGFKNAPPEPPPMCSAKLENAPKHAHRCDLEPAHTGQHYCTFCSEAFEI